MVAKNPATKIVCSHQVARCIVLAVPTSIPRNIVVSINQPTVDQCAKPRLHLSVVHAERFHRETGQTKGKENSEQPPVAPVMAQARLAAKGTAIHRKETAEAEGDAEDVHRQLVNEIVPAVMKVIGAVVRNREKGGADRLRRQSR